MSFAVLIQTLVGVTIGQGGFAFTVSLVPLVPATFVFLHTEQRFLQVLFSVIENCSYNLWILTWRTDSYHLCIFTQMFLQTLFSFIENCSYNLCIPTQRTDSYIYHLYSSTQMFLQTLFSFSFIKNCSCNLCIPTQRTDSYHLCSSTQSFPSSVHSYICYILLLDITSLGCCEAYRFACLQ